MKNTDTIDKLRAKARELPSLPGVYIMHDLSGKIIYVGKAKSLRDRVYQYFCNTSAHTPKVISMVQNINDFEYIICDSEYEALMLEAAQIKQHMPHYNILLKDDKAYHYIKVSSGDWPKITVAHQIEDDGAEYIGPYYTSYIIKNTVDEALKVFGLPRCNLEFPRDIGKKRPCLNHHIGLCSAPCSGKISVSQYKESVRDAVKYIKCGEKDSVADLKSRMMKAADELDFEKAAKIRDRITAIQKSIDKQKVVASPNQRQDVICMVENNNEACFQVFNFHEGRLCDSESYYVQNVIDIDEARTDFFLSYYSGARDIPRIIVTDSSFKDIEIVEKILSDNISKKVSVIVPQRGEQAALCKMCSNNGYEFLSKKQEKNIKGLSVIKELGELLGLKSIPKIIESYDISHTAGSDTVGGMVVFCDGIPNKKLYKRFKIKDGISNDDYAAMAQMLERRIDEYLNGKNSGFSVLPDLIFVDGGKGQVSVARKVLEKKGINIPLFGMVKDNSHKTRAIASNDGEIQIKANKSVFKLITQIQDETHRFAIEYHRKMSQKSKLQSGLCEIPTIGPTRAKRLLIHFNTLNSISLATVDELKSVPGMNEQSAQAVFDYFNKS